MKFNGIMYKIVYLKYKKNPINLYKMWSKTEPVLPSIHTLSI